MRKQATLRSSAVRVTRRTFAMALASVAVVGGLTGATAAPADPLEAAQPVVAAVSPQLAGQAALAALAAVAPRTFATPPTPGLVEASRPLGTPAPLAVPSNSYTFLQANPDGTPITYDPCRPIHYVTRAANTPAGGAQLIKDAVTAVSRATGLVFIDDGATDETPTPRSVARRDYQPERYGDRWAPVLIAWATPEEEPSFVTPAPVTSTLLGLGGSHAKGYPGMGAIYVSGQLTLSAAGAKWAVERGYGLEYLRALVMHEFAHVVGLGHYEADEEVMNPHRTPGNVSDFQAGDLAGLAVLGQGKCQPAV